MQFALLTLTVMQLLSLRFLKHMLINSTLRADIVELRPAMLVYRIARDRFAVAAHRFKNAWREYDQGDPDEEWGELYSGVPAPPWPTAGSLSYSIGLLQYDYEKDTRTIPWTLKGHGGGILLRQDSGPSSGSGGVFGIIPRDPEAVLIHPTTARIQGRIIRTGTEGLRLLGLLLTSPCAVRAQSRSHVVPIS